MQTGRGNWALKEKESNGQNTFGLYISTNFLIYAKDCN